MAQSASSAKSRGYLQGIRVLEVADELGEFCGKVFAGLGADVIKVEPPGGSPTRKHGPFYEDKPGPERSLYFWHYNFGKRGITLDLKTAEGRAQFRELVKRADVVIETTPRRGLKKLGLDYAALKAANPQIVVCRITPFGDDGPYKDYKACDLIHLALGGVMMNNGYDALPNGTYETPPIAPQMWQAYHIGAEMAALGTMGALFYRRQTGVGQLVSTAIHEAIAKQTEGDLPQWIYAKKKNLRQTCRHSQPERNPFSIGMTKDGRWIMPTVGGATPAVGGNVLGELLERYGLAGEMKDPQYNAQYNDPAYRMRPEVQARLWSMARNFIGRFTFDHDIWREAQDLGMVWGPERRPEENLKDPHFALRQTFLQVEHPELGKTFSEVGARWMCREVSWRTGPRAPLLGEHNVEVLGDGKAGVSGGLRAEAPRVIQVREGYQPKLSKHGKPWALAGVRVIDLSWLLASAGGSRFLSSLGAEVIRVEHASRPDFIRWHSSTPPAGGREQRDREPGPFNAVATGGGPRSNLIGARSESPNRSGFFMDINAGRRSFGLNLTTAKGKEILRRLLADADIVAEGFSPGTMDRMGFGWAELQKINPRLIYVQQSGMGQIGSYGRARSFGPIAQAFSGMSEMSGLPEPYPPAGIGYSFLDWFGAYNMANAMLAALHYREVSGKGVWIDSSQIETGTYLVGTSILDYSANGRRWNRYGNRSPYKPAAPHGAYRAAGAVNEGAAGAVNEGAAGAVNEGAAGAVNEGAAGAVNEGAAGEDRWIAIACFAEREWKALVKVLGSPSWASEARFATLKSRIANQDALDALVEAETRKWDRYKLQEALQRAGVPAGVCQDAPDRYDTDPQLKHLKWLTELKQSEIGTWPVKEHPAKLSETPAHMGGVIDRHGPSYGEDNEYVLRELLGFSTEEIEKLGAEGVL